MSFVLIINGRGRERRQQRTLRFRVIVAKRVDKEMNRIAQIVASLFGKTCDQCDCCLDAIAIGALNSLPGFIQIVRMDSAESQLPDMSK